MCRSYAPEDDELGERQLIEAAAEAMHRCLHRDHLIDEPGGQHEPGKAEAWGERLARRSRVDDVIRGKGLHRADRLAVVSEFAVVVVLDDHATRVHRPLDGAASPLGVEWDTERELVRGGEEQCARRPHAIDCGATQVHRHRLHAQSRGLGDVAVQRVAVPFDDERPRSAASQRLTHEPESLRKARADHDALGCDRDPASTGQVLAECGAQLR